MKRTILNIRGCHCSGKTTLVRSLINKKQHTVEELACLGYKTYVTVCDGGKTVVLGRYDQGACGGCDRFKGGAHVKATIIEVVRRYNPNLIIYEGIMYSVTYKMATEIAKLATDVGYQWVSLYLFRDYQEVLKLLTERNKGKQVNQKAVYTKYERAGVVYEKLRETGYTVKKVNVTGVSIPQLVLLAERFINEECI